MRWCLVYHVKSLLIQMQKFRLLTYLENAKFALSEKKYYLKNHHLLLSVLTPNLHKFVAGYGLCVSVFGLTERCTGVGASLHVKCAKGCHRNGINYANDAKSTIAGLPPHCHSEQQYSRLNARQDDTHDLPFFQFFLFTYIFTLCGELFTSYEIKIENNLTMKVCTQFL